MSPACMRVADPGIAEATFYVWKKKFAGFGVTELRKMRMLEEENTRLKRPAADLTLDRHELEEPVLWRRNRDMAITVRADVKDGEQGVSATQEIRPMLKEIEAKLPFGYRIDVGGAVEESDTANRGLMAVFLLRCPTACGAQRQSSRHMRRRNGVCQPR